MFETTGKLISHVNVHNLSAQGCCVEGPGVPAVGETCELAIEWEGRKFRCEAMIKWIKAKGLAGLEFLSVDEDRLAALREIFATLHLEPPRQASDKCAGKASKPARGRAR